MTGLCRYLRDICLLSVDSSCNLRTTMVFPNTCSLDRWDNLIIIIIKRISGAPVYRTRWEHRALYSNTRTHTHARTHARTHAHTDTDTDTHTLTLSLSHTHTHIHTHTLSLSLSLSLSLTHTHTHTHTHTVGVVVKRITVVLTSGCLIIAYPYASTSVWTYQLQKIDDNERLWRSSGYTIEEAYPLFAFRRFHHELYTSRKRPTPPGKGQQTLHFVTA